MIALAYKHTMYMRTVVSANERVSVLVFQLPVLVLLHTVQTYHTVHAAYPKRNVDIIGSVNLSACLCAT